MKRATILLLFCICSLGALFAQTQRVDSLKQAIQTAANNSERLKNILLLCAQRSSISPDTLLYYANRARSLSANGTKNDQLWAEYYIANALNLKGKYDSASSLLNINYKAAQAQTTDAKLSNYYSFLKGKFFMKEGKRKEALSLYLTILNKAETANDTLSVIIAFNSVGWVYMELDQYREAIRWFSNAIQSGTPSWFEKYSIMFSNIAASYNSLGQNDSAKFYIDKALYYSKQSQNLTDQANALAIQTGILSETGEPKLAEKSMNDALVIRRVIGDPFFIVSDLAELSNFYASHGPQEKGIALAREGIEMAYHYGLNSKLYILFNALANNYKKAHNYSAYAETLEKLLQLKDSSYKQTSAEELANLQTKYEIQKEQNTILQQNFHLKQSKYFLYASLIFSIILILSSLLLLRSYRRRQALRIKLLNQEKLQEKEKDILLARESERKRIAADLHDSLGAYAASIAVNVKLLEDEPMSAENRAVIHDLRNNSLEVVTQLRDSIWALKKDSLALTSVSDRIKSFIQQIQKSYPATTVNVIENINVDYLLSSTHAYHLFRTAQEAITNALRHSKAGEIVVVIDSNPGQWKITISDDGIGLIPGKAPGDGMANIRQRAAEAEWQIDWSAGEKKGTCISISKENPDEPDIIKT